MSGHPDPGHQARGLAALAERHKLALVTLRREWPSLMERLLWLRLTDPFSAVCNPGNSHRSISGADVTRMAAPELDSGSIVVGDTEEGVRAAREIGSAVVCVTNGVRGRRYLEAPQPDNLIPSVARLPALLRSLDGSEARAPAGLGRAASPQAAPPSVAQPTNM